MKPVFRFVKIGLMTVCLFAPLRAQDPTPQVAPLPPQAPVPPMAPLPPKAPRAIGWDDGEIDAGRLQAQIARSKATFLRDQSDGKSGPAPTIARALALSMTGSMREPLAISRGCSIRSTPGRTGRCTGRLMH